MGLILLALYQVPHSIIVLSGVRRARTPTAGCSFSGPRCSQSPQKVLHTTRAPFLVWKFLIINRLTRTFLIPRYAVFINILSSFVNILSF